MATTTSPVNVWSLLPVDIAETILQLAATGHPPTARALALTSKQVSRLTAERRWGTAVLKDMAQAMRFFVTLIHSPSKKSPTRQQIKRSPVYRIVNDLGKDSLLSRPDKAATLLRNLYMELSDYTETIWHSFIGELLDYGYEAPESSSQCSWTPIESYNGMSITLRLDVLSLGPSESIYFSRIRGHPIFVFARELTIVMYSSTYADFLPDWLTRPGLQRIHGVGINSQSPITGLGMPPFLQNFRAGSTLQLGQPGPNHERIWKDEKPWLITHIRYDTTEYAYKPAAVLAGHMLPFLREVCFAGDSGSSGMELSTVTGNANGTVQGPFISVMGDDSMAAEVLRDMGVGQFKRVHFTWDGETEPLRSELVERITEGYGWAPAGASNADGTDWLEHYRFVKPGAGDMVDEVLRNEVGNDLNRLANIEKAMAAKVRQRPGGAAFAGRKLRYAIRAPATVVKLGGAQAAISADARLALFLNRAQGGSGAWA